MYDYIIAVIQKRFPYLQKINEVRMHGMFKKKIKFIKKI